MLNNFFMTLIYISGVRRCILNLWTSMCDTIISVQGLATCLCCVTWFDFLYSNGSIQTSLAHVNVIDIHFITDY